MGTPSASPSSSPSSSVSASASSTPSASPSLAIADDQIVTVEEAKLHLRVTGTDDDILIDSYIDAATVWAQEYQHRKYITETCIDYLDAFPEVIRPRWSPLIAVTKIEYIDTAGVWQTWSSTEYDVDADSEPGRIVPAYSESYPDYRGDINGIKVTYTAGYGTSHDDVPADIRNAILLLVGDWYSRRENIVEGAIGQLPIGVKALLNMRRLVHV